jgi:hypothetical protein
MVQPYLIPKLEVNGTSPLTQTTCSHQNARADEARLALENCYQGILQETQKFNRKLVSYQGNKGELVHGWIRYKEGFSTQLVEDRLSSRSK